VNLREAVFGTPPSALAAVGVEAVQLSPFIPDAAAIEDLADGSLDRLVVHAPPGTLERRYALAHGLRALAADGVLIALAPKDKGGARLRKELEAFGCPVIETARRHHRICATKRPEAPTGLAEAMADGAPRLSQTLGLWTQPGLFAWDRVDPGSALLLETKMDLSGRGADLGCGGGVVSRAVLGSPKVTSLTLIDLDRRALDAAKRNVADARVAFLQYDLRGPPPLTDLDFIVMNPPFHEGGDEDRHLGQAFIAAAAVMLRKGGVCRLVANIALPYEAVMKRCFSSVVLVARGGGYKVLEARR